jgi:hypothetical protein
MTHTRSPRSGSPLQSRLPRSVVGEERWPAGLAGGLAAGATSAPWTGRPGVSASRDTHESPQRQPAGGVAEVDPDQEAALRRLSLAILNGKTDKALELAGPSPS